MGAACWRRAHEYAALEGEATEQEQRMALCDLNAELGRLQEVHARQRETASHMTFMIRKLQSTQSKRFYVNNAKKDLAAVLKKLGQTEARIAGVELAIEKIEDLTLCVQFVRALRLHVDALEACHAQLIAMDAERILRECDEAVEAHRHICTMLAEPLLSEQPDFYDDDDFDEQQPTAEIAFREELVATLGGGDDDSLRKLLALDPAPLPDHDQEFFGNSMLVNRMQNELDPRAVRSLMNRVDVITKRPPTSLRELTN